VLAKGNGRVRGRYRFVSNPDKYSDVYGAGPIEYCNTVSELFAAGEVCVEPPACADGCENGWRGDMMCDPACNNSECGFDNGDCDLCSDFCSAADLKDGQCQPECYTEGCGFDSGDCEDVCIDKDFTASKTDSEGYLCHEYVGAEDTCGDHDTAQFTAAIDCCACGGGLINGNPPNTDDSSDDASSSSDSGSHGGSPACFADCIATSLLAIIDNTEDPESVSYTCAQLRWIETGVGCCTAATASQEFIDDVTSFVDNEKAAQQCSDTVDPNEPVTEIVEKEVTVIKSVVTVPSSTKLVMDIEVPTAGTRKFENFAKVITKSITKSLDGNGVALVKTINGNALDSASPDRKLAAADIDVDFDIILEVSCTPSETKTCDTDTLKTDNEAKLLAASTAVSTAASSGGLATNIVAAAEEVKVEEKQVLEAKLLAEGKSPAEIEAEMALIETEIDSILFAASTVTATVVIPTEISVDMVVETEEIVTINLEVVVEDDSSSASSSSGVVVDDDEPTDNDVLGSAANLQPKIFVALAAGIVGLIAMI